MDEFTVTRKRRTLGEDETDNMRVNIDIDVQPGDEITTKKRRSKREKASGFGMIVVTLLSTLVLLR